MMSSDDQFSSIQENLIEETKVRTTQTRDIEQIRKVLAGMYKALVFQSQNLQVLHQFFDLNLQPLNNQILSLNDQMNDMSINVDIQNIIRQKNAPLIKNSLTEFIRKDIEPVMEKKFEPIKELVKLQVIMNAQQDGLMYRSKLLEQKLVSLNVEIQDRPNKRDIFELNDTLKLFQMHVYDHLKLLAQKETVNNMEAIMRDLGSQVAQKVNKSDLEESLKTKITVAEQSISEMVFQHFAKKDQTESSFNRIEALQTSISTKFNTFQSVSTIRLDQLKDNHQKLQVDLLFRVKQDEFDKFLVYASDYVHKNQIDDIYSQIIPSVNKIKEDVGRFNLKMIDFKKFLIKTDSDILYKASKMDFELLKKEISLKTINLEQQYIQMTELYAKFLDFEIYINQFYNQNQERLIKETVNEIHSTLQTMIQQDVQRVFGSYQIPQIKQDFTAVRKLIDQKVNKQELLKVFDNKSSKLSVEILTQISQQQQNNMRFVIQQTQQFMELFSSQFSLESLNFKRQETSKITAEMSSLLKRLDQNDFNSILNPKSDPCGPERKLSMPDSEAVYNSNLVQMGGTAKMRDMESLLDESILSAAEVRNNKKRMFGTPTNSTNFRVQLRPLMISQREGSVIQEIQDESPRQKKLTSRSKSSQQPEIKVQKDKNKISKQ